MLIAIISDTHDRVSSVADALKIMDSRRVEVILHCGDICDPETARLFPAHTHFVFGNCDRDRADLDEVIAQTGATSHGDWGHLDIAGRPLAFTHGDNRQLLHDLEHAGTFDYLFHGHTHVAAEHVTGTTRVINPGALQRVAVRTFLLLDPETGETESVRVE